METTYLIDKFVNTKPGDPYRLFPFGQIVKNGKSHEITPEYAARFKLPHFKPPIKLGSHEDTTPAGGHILSLEVRADGLYAITEMTDKGSKALSEGDYRYHSPEVIWDGAGIEDPTTGKIIEGPLIIGDALLHTPHLGEAAALYSIEPITSEGSDNTMTDQPQMTIPVPQGFWDKFWMKLGILDDPSATKPAPTAPAAPVTPAPVPEPVKPVKVEETDQFKALQIERDDFARKLAEYETSKAKAEEINTIKATLQNKDQFGSIFLDLKAVDEAASMLQSMTKEQRDWVTRNFSAYIQQINESHLTTEIGSAADNDAKDTKVSAFDAAIRAEMAKAKVDYATAYRTVKEAQPDLFKSYLAER